MSFGFSPSDIVALVNIVSKTYQGWKKACGEYADVTATLDNLLIILNRIEEESRRPTSVLIRTQKDATDLKDVLSNTTPTVRELHAIVERYKSLGLGKSREKNWDKIRFGVRNLSDVRSKLNQHLAALSTYLSTVGLSSLTRIERGLETLPQIKETVDALAAEIRAGRREGTVMTTYEDDEKEVWKQFRRELVGEGMKSGMIHKYKPQIRAYLRALAEQGDLEEQSVEEDGSEVEDEMSSKHPQPETGTDATTIPGGRAATGEHGGPQVEADTLSLTGSDISCDTDEPEERRVNMLEQGTTSSSDPVAHGSVSARSRQGGEEDDTRAERETSTTERSGLHPPSTSLPSMTPGNSATRGREYRSKRSIQAEISQLEAERRALRTQRKAQEKRDTAPKLHGDQREVASMSVSEIEAEIRDLESERDALILERNAGEQQTKSGRDSSYEGGRDGVAATATATQRATATFTATADGECYINPQLPVYPKVHTKYLDVETLIYYDIPYEYDRQDPSYIIILREMSNYEADILFEHTRRLRSSHKI
ncbi:hypothetical protein LTR86_003544 [Recurvomyces mirabilis]|nr:hypothetical protein LTR86_003544 [Recurvomyces mirabilis]